MSLPILEEIKRETARVLLALDNCRQTFDRLNHELGNLNSARSIYDPQYVQPEVTKNTGSSASGPSAGVSLATAVESSLISLPTESTDAMEPGPELSGPKHPATVEQSEGAAPHTQLKEQRNALLSALEGCVCILQNAALGHDGRCQEYIQSRRGTLILAMPVIDESLAAIAKAEGTPK